jgi:hypothetical protein
MDIDGALVDKHIAPPHGVEQLRARKDTPRARHEKLEQPEFGRPQMQLSARAANAMWPAFSALATSSGRDRRRIARTRAISSGNEKGFTT